MLCTAFVLGCGVRGADQPPSKPLEVQFGLPVKQKIAVNEYFPGKTEAVKNVDIFTRSTGHLDQWPGRAETLLATPFFGVSTVGLAGLPLGEGPWLAVSARAVSLWVNFKDGADVKEGQVLFEIDPRAYETAFNRATAALEQAKARVERLDADYKRGLAQRPTGSLSQQEFDKISGDLKEAHAQVGVNESELRTASINLSFCKVTAPFDGRVSKRFVDSGKLVKEKETALTNIVVIEPEMFVTFDIDERTMHKLRQLLTSGKSTLSQNSQLPFSFGLSDGDAYPMQGKLTFVDNQLDTGTGTLRLRGTFNNTKDKLLPGLFVRVRLPIGDEQEALLIIEKALMTDQDEKYVYIVNKENKVENRKVTLGPMVGGMRVIESGITERDRVIVTGLQRLQPNLPVTPKDVGMTLKPAKSSQ